MVPVGIGEEAGFYVGDRMGKKQDRLTEALQLPFHPALFQ